MRQCSRVAAGQPQRTHPRPECLRQRDDLQGDLAVEQVDRAVDEGKGEQGPLP